MFCNNKVYNEVVVMLYIFDSSEKIIDILFKGDFLQIVFALAGRVNFFFAFFNLLPILMLDGSKVFAWNKLIWAFFFLLSAVLVFMPELFF